MSDTWGDLLNDRFKEERYKEERYKEEKYRAAGTLSAEEYRLFPESKAARNQSIMHDSFTGAMGALGAGTSPQAIQRPTPRFNRLMFNKDPMPDDWRGGEITRTETNADDDCITIHFISKWTGDGHMSTVRLYLSPNTPWGEVLDTARRYMDILNVRRLG